MVVIINRLKKIFWRRCKAELVVTIHTSAGEQTHAFRLYPGDLAEFVDETGHAPIMIHMVE